MNILLIHPNLSVEDRYGKALGKVGPTTEPLGLAYLAAALREKRKDNIRILDCAAQGLGTADLEKYLKKNKYDLIGVTWLTPMYLKAIETINMIKKNSNAKIVVGGPHITIFPEMTLKENSNIDFAIVGEGEKTIVELCDALEKKNSLAKIKGLIYRDGKKIKINPVRKFIKNIDDVPLPARDLLPMNLYRPTPTYWKQLPSYVIITSRGCPFRCIYCSRVFGKVYRLHSVDRVIKEMWILVNEYKAKEIIFRDDTFTINHTFVENLCKRIIKEGLHKKVRWTCMTKVDLVNFDLLKLMKKAGCWSIHYGIESGNQRLLDLIKKDITLEQSKNAVKWTRKAGIETKAFFMLGLPTETREESFKTIEFTKELDPDWIQVTLTTPYPGTELYYLAQQDGTLKSLKWENYQTWAAWSDKEPVYVSSGRDGEELKDLQKRAMRIFYFRSKIIIRLLIQLRSLYMLKLYFKGSLALFKSAFER